MTTHPAILMVIAPENFRDEEFFVPYERFISLGWAVTVASPRTGLAKGMLGAEFDVQTQVDNTLQADDFDAIVIAGGLGSPTWLFNDAVLLKLVQDFTTQNKTVAAICLSGVVLANAGVLNGKQATVYPTPDSLAAYETHQVHYQDQAVVIDGQFITANGPDASEAYTQAIEKALVACSVS